MFLMRHLNKLHLCLKLQRQWDPDVCMIQRCGWGASSEILCIYYNYLANGHFKMNDTEHECRRIVFKCALKSSHMVSSCSIVSTGLSSETDWSISLLDVCPTLFFTRGRITLMRPVYPPCFGPTLTFYLTDFLWKAVRPDKTLWCHVSVSIVLLKDLIWFL